MPETLLQIVDFLLQDWQLILILSSVALVAGITDSIAGGGGLIALPALILSGIPVHQALATSKMQSIIGTSSASFFYVRKGFYKDDKIIWGVIFSLLGSLIGGVAVVNFKAENLKILIPILLSLVFIYILKNKYFLTTILEAKLSQFKYYVIFGTSIGFYDGFFGPGTGFFILSSLIYFSGQSFNQALGCSKILNVASNLSSVLVFGYMGLINYKIAVPMAIFQILGSRIGSYFAVKKGAQLVRPLLLALIFATILKTSYEIYFN